MTAKILAILQGKESQQTAGITSQQLQDGYSEAYKLYTSNHVAILTPAGYTVEYHPPKWTRRVR